MSSSSDDSDSSSSSDSEEVIDELQTAMDDVDAEPPAPAPAPTPASAPAPAEALAPAPAPAEAPEPAVEEDDGQSTPRMDASVELEQEEEVELDYEQSDDEKDTKNSPEEEDTKVVEMEEAELESSSAVEDTQLEEITEEEDKANEDRTNQSEPEVADDITQYEPLPMDAERPNRIRLKRIINSKNKVPPVQTTSGAASKPSLTVKPPPTLKRAISVATPRQQYTKYPPQIMKHLLLLKSKTPIAWDPKAFARDYREVMQKFTRKRPLPPKTSDDHSISSNGDKNKRAKKEAEAVKSYASMSRDELAQLSQKCHNDGKQLKNLAETMPESSGERGKFLLYAALKFMEESHIAEVLNSQQPPSELLRGTAGFFISVANSWKEQHKGLYACCHFCAALCYYTSFRLQRHILHRKCKDLQKSAKESREESALVNVKTLKDFTTGTNDLFEAFKHADAARGAMHMSEAASKKSNNSGENKALPDGAHFTVTRIPEMLTHVNHYMNDEGM